MEVAFQYVNEFEENILGFCNNIYTQEGGTHITGFKTKFTMVMNQYARELGILKEKDQNFTGVDVRNGMTAIVAVKHPAPRFEGQTKTKLDNPDAGTVVSSVTNDEIQLYFDKHLDDLKAVLACAEKSAKSDVPKKRQRPICSQSRNFRLTATESWQTAKAVMRRNVKSLLSREILPAVRQRQRETDGHRQFCQFVVRF